MAGLVGFASDAAAVRTSFWKIDSADAFLEGEHVAGVAIESDGTVTLAPAWDSVATRLDGVSYIWCAARDSKGRVYFGTGDNGRIYRWSRDGGAKLLWETGAAEITCMAIDPGDNVYAGSAPGGIIYRVSARGDTSRYYETGEESVWSLLWGKDGALYAGTGTSGRIFRVTAAGKGAVHAETKDVNVLALAETSDGAILAGTASRGLLIRVERGGGIRVLYDADAEELRAIAVLADGSVAVGTNRGQVAHGAGGSPSGGAGDRSGSSTESRYAIEVTPQEGGKCGVFLVQPDGSARLLYSPPVSYLYAMVPYDATSVLVATGESAALFRVSVDKKFALLGVPEEKQVLAIARGGGETFVATGNEAVLYSLGKEAAKDGTYTSQPYDLRSVASWGRATARISGEGTVLWSARSGLSEEPDDGWSAWSKETSLAESAPVEAPAARFLQYRLRLKRGGGPGPVVRSVEVAYQQRNLPPEIGDIQIYGPANPYMEGGPEYRPPQISQSFPSGLKVEYSVPRSGPRPVADASVSWARGVRTIAWEAIDPNGDPLRYQVYLKADDEKEWRRLVADHPERVYTFDSESYPNGSYRVRIEATDLPGNPPSGALKTERLGPSFDIDNLPPRIDGLQSSIGAAPKGGRATATVTGTAADADTRITSIEYSVDGGEWLDVFPEDGIFDELQESFRFEVKDLAPGEHRISVRASDLDRNVAAAKVILVSR